VQQPAERLRGLRLRGARLALEVTLLGLMAHQVVSRHRTPDGARPIVERPRLRPWSTGSPRVARGQMNTRRRYLRATCERRAVAHWNRFALAIVAGKAFIQGRHRLEVRSAVPCTVAFAVVTCT
jgi:hypothetical protein